MRIPVSMNLRAAADAAARTAIAVTRVFVFPFAEGPRQG